GERRPSAVSGRPGTLVGSGGTSIWGRATRCSTAMPTAPAAPARSRRRERLTRVMRLLSPTVQAYRETAPPRRDREGSGRRDARSPAGHGRLEPPSAGPPPRPPRARVRAMTTHAWGRAGARARTQPPPPADARLAAESHRTTR